MKSPVVRNKVSLFTFKSNVTLLQPPPVSWKEGDHSLCWDKYLGCHLVLIRVT